MTNEERKVIEPEQEPVAMRMPKVGDKVICIEDDSLGEVAYLTAGGSPEIKFDDGSHGTYMLREFAELFRYATTPPQRKPLTHEQRFDLLTKFEPYKNKWGALAILIDMVEAAHGIKE